MLSESKKKEKSEEAVQRELKENPEKLNDLAETVKSLGQRHKNK